MHVAVEARFHGLDIAHASDYAEFLARHAVCILPLEAALDEAGIEGVIRDWPLRRRGAALAGDLAALCRPIPGWRAVQIAAGAEALGAAYVLEGSRLGASMLLRLVGVDLPTAFLRHGHHARLWHSFLPHLDSLDATEIDGAIKGACQAFSLFLPGSAE